MNTLAMDIGGTKFTLAAFEGARIVRRESRLTDGAGGRDWMLAQLREISFAWQAEMEFHNCGIGFGGPVNYRAQRIALSTHVGGWQAFELSAWVKSELGIPAVMDNDANVGGLGEAVHGAGAGYDPLLYMTISTGIGGGIAIPHVRNPILLHVDRPFVALFLLQHPVDFDSIDGEPVHALFFVVSSSIPVHLRILAELGFVLRDPELRSLLKQRATDDEILGRIGDLAVATTGQHPIARLS